MEARDSFCFPKKTKNPNPSPIEKRFGFSWFGATGRIRTSGLPGRSRTLYPAELRSLIYEKRRYSVFQSCKVVNFQQWSIRGLTTVDHHVFASANNDVSNKSGVKTCRIAVVGDQCSIQLSYGRRFMNYCQAEPRPRMPLQYTKSGSKMQMFS